jgi:hypothetical protein
MASRCTNALLSTSFSLILINRNTRISFKGEELYSNQPIGNDGFVSVPDAVSWRDDGVA